MSVLNALRLSHAPATAFSVLGLYWGCFAALVPQIKAQIGADDATFGLLLLGTAFGLVLTMALAPVFDRRLGRLAMPLGAFALTIAFLLPGTATTPLLFVAAMITCGLASGLTDVVMNTRVSELETRHTRNLMNANHGMFSLAYAVGAFGTGLGREAGLPPIAIFAIAGLVTLMLIPRMRMEVDAAPEANALKSGFPLATVLICGLVVLVAFMTEAAVESWSALHVERTLGGRAAEGALGPTMLGLTMAIGRFGGQAVADRLSDLAVIFWATCLSIAGALIVAIAPAPPVAYLGFGIMGLGVSVIGPLGLALVGRLVPPALRSTAISRTAIIGFMGFFLAPTIMGLTSHGFGLRVAFASLALALLVIFPLLVLLRKHGA